MKHWQLIANETILRQIYEEPLVISYKRGKSLKDILVKAKLLELKAVTRVEGVSQACQPLMTLRYLFLAFKGIKPKNERKYVLLFTESESLSPTPVNLFFRIIINSWPHP